MAASTVLLDLPGVLGAVPGGQRRVGFLQVIRNDLMRDHCLQWQVMEFPGNAPEKETGSSEDLPRNGMLIALSDLACYKLNTLAGEEFSQMVFVEKDGKTHRPLFMTSPQIERLLAVLKLKSITFIQAKNDPTLFLCVDPKISEVNATLSNLQLLDRPEAAGGLWDFVNNMKNDPYAATLTAFCKITDKLLYSGATAEQQEYLNSLMQHPNLLANFDFGDALLCPDGEADESSEEFEVISAKPPIWKDLDLTCRHPPVTPEEWMSFQEEDGSFKRVEDLKRRIFLGGLDPQLRPEGWKLLLGVDDWKLSKDDREANRSKLVKEYLRMKTQWNTMSSEQIENFSAFRERQSQIEKDVVRTDRAQDFYAEDDSPNVQLLNDILMTYTMMDFDFGYTQGMSDMLSPILYVTKNEVDAFWCFVEVMKRVKKCFDFEHGGLKRQLLDMKDVLKAVDPELHNYLISKDCDNFLFCFRWLLLYFKREFSYDDTLQLWEVLWTNYQSKNFHILIAVTMLHMERSVIMENRFGFPEILKHLNDKSQNFELDKILEFSEALFRKLEAQDFLSERVREVLCDASSDQ